MRYFTFRLYLSCNYDRADSIGAFARAALNDAGWPKGKGRNPLPAYQSHLQASSETYGPEMQQALELCWQNFQQLVKAYRRPRRRRLAEAQAEAPAA